MTPKEAEAESNPGGVVVAAVPFESAAPADPGAVVSGSLPGASTMPSRQKLVGQC